MRTRSDDVSTLRLLLAFACAFAVDGLSTVQVRKAFGDCAHIVLESSAGIRLKRKPGANEGWCLESKRGAQATRAGPFFCLAVGKPSDVGLRLRKRKGNELLCRVQV